jgi:hydrogenase maturation protease
VNPTPPEGRTVVLGVGNELCGDDALGVLVARALSHNPPPGGVQIVEAAVGGVDLLFDMEGAARAIIADAVDMGAEPGTLRVFRPDDVEAVLPGAVASLHHVGLAEVLKLGAAVGIQPEVWVVGVQPRGVRPGDELSPAVADAVPRAVAAVRRLLAGQEGLETDSHGRESALRQGGACCE